MAGITYRKAVQGDVAALVRLSAACEGAPRWSETVWESVFATAGVLRRMWVAERAGAMVGFGVAACREEVAELESVAVLEAERRQGIGREICERALQWSAGQGAREMELEVRASSEGARALYAAMGFVEQGRRREYYRAPIEDAILMRIRL